MAISLGKAGYRGVKAGKGFAVGWFYNPCAWLNACSSLCAGAAFCSTATGKVLPGAAPLCYAISAGCSCVADTLDGSMSVSSLILVLNDKRENFLV